MRAVIKIEDPNEEIETYRNMLDCLKLLKIISRKNGKAKKKKKKRKKSKILNDGKLTAVPALVVFFAAFMSSSIVSDP